MAASLTKHRAAGAQPPADAGLHRRRLALAVLALIAFASLFFHPHPEDFGDYAAFGRMVLARGNLYGSVANTGTPFFFLCCVPLALLYDAAPRAALIGWTLLNYAALLLTLALAARMIYGRRLTLGARIQPRAEGAAAGEPAAVSLGSAEVLVPLFLTLPYLIDHLEFHQINLILLALAFGGLFLDHQGRSAAGGIALAAAAAIKVMPVIFVPYLVYRRRWRAALWSIAALIAFSLSPALLFGWTRFWRDLATWWRKNAVGGGAWDAAGPNQSVYAMWDRILGHHLAPFVVRGVATNLPFSADPRVRLAWLATLAVVGIAALLAFADRSPRRDRSARLAPNSWRQGSWRSLLEWSALFLVAALFGPVTWKHYLVVMILPNLLLYAVWRSSPSGPASGADPRARRVAAVALIACAAMAFPTGYAFGRALALRLETGSIVTVAVLLMLAVLLWLRARFATHPA